MTPAALQSKSSTLGPRARGDELGLTAVAFSLSIRSHLHLGFASRPREHLLAQAVHQVAPAGRAARIQRVFLVLPRGRPPESSSNAREKEATSLPARRQLKTYNYNKGFPPDSSRLGKVFPLDGRHIRGDPDRP